MHLIFSLMSSTQRYLFPHIESELGPLTEKEKEFVSMAVGKGHLCVYRHKFVAE